MKSDMEMAERDNHEELGRKPILQHDPGHDENGGLHTMVEGAVRLVTMLNFMKVELGEYKSLKSKEQWRSIGVEFLATLLFVYLGCGSVVASGVLETELTSARLTVIALAHGLAITFLVASTGAISGGHINPVVTLAFVVAGKENIIRGSLYIAAQLVGGICGAALLGASIPAADLGHLGTHSLGHGTSVGNAFLMELMLTFTLVYVIFGVAVDRRGPGVIAPIPIGLVVVVDHLVGIPFTGASMNPARSFGPAVVSGIWPQEHWVYWVAPSLGSALAAVIYRYIIMGTTYKPPEAAAMITPGPGRKSMSAAI
ncbi:unnamed protein product [Closterium sp. Naga37s-1]|nr:unnamed protein product [Closterium sp. Naga37s-1]